MKYCSIKLYPPNYKNWNREIELLRKKRLIGVSDKDNIYSIRNFKKLNIGDVVIVIRGNKPLALVKVIGETIDLEQDFYDQLDWFRFRRKIEILDFADDDLNKFPFGSGRLTCFTEKSESYKFISDWHKKVVGKEKNFFIKKIYINKYKIFKDFTLNLDNEKGEISPVIVLVGVNGSGKSTILKFIKNFYEITNKKDNLSFIELNNGKKINFYDEEREILTFGGNKTINESIRKFEDNLIKFDICENLKSIKKNILLKMKEFIFERRYNPTVAYEELKDKINNILNDLNILFEFDSIDKYEEIIFKNKITKQEFIIDNLSSGEQTLLIKTLYLYLQDLTNKIILIDEPELSLHPSWQSRIFKLYEKFALENNCQIIMATHSPQIISSAKPKYIRVLTFKENKIIPVQVNRSYGLEFQKILLDIMGVKELRIPEIEEKISNLKKYIEKKDREEFINLFDELVEILGEDDTDLQLMKFQANIKGLNV